VGIIPSVGTSPTAAHTKQQFLRGKPWASVGFRTRPHRRCKMSSPSSSTRGMPVTPIRPGRPGKLRRSVGSKRMAGGNGDGHRSIDGRGTGGASRLSPSSPFPRSHVRIVKEA
jgi:hypothetical protein